MSVKLGRNDPCHCGSGRKYKKCHMEADQLARQSVAPAPAPAPPPAQWTRSKTRAPRRSSAPGSLSRLMQRIRDSVKLLPPEERHKLKTAFGPGQVLLEYAEREEEIMRASRQLEAHRAEFERLLLDADQCIELMERLFTEERFADFRFTAAEVEAAMKQLGYPPPPEADDEWERLTAQAIGHIVDENRMALIRMRLALHVPELVDAGRLMDAWMVQSSMLSIADADATRVDPFLAYMFDFGFQAWQEQENQHRERVFREMGLDADTLNSMGPEELKAWYDEQQKDPAKWARLNEILAREAPDPARIRANIDRMLQDAMRVFDTPEGWELLPDYTEMEPWLTRMNERLRDLRPEAEQELTPELRERIATETLIPAMEEAALGLFTPERIRKLGEGLSALRQRALSAGNQELAGHATAAVGCLTSDPSEPVMLHFLIMVTHASIRHLDQNGPDSSDEPMAGEELPSESGDGPNS